MGQIKVSLVLEVGISWRWLRTIQKVENLRRKYFCRQERWHVINVNKDEKCIHLICKLIHTIVF